MTIEEFFEAIREANQLRPRSHTLRPATTAEEVGSWQAQHGKELPRDTVHMLLRSNGLGLHQAWYDSEPLFELGAFQLYGLENLSPASEAMYGSGHEHHELMGDWLAIGEGPDGALFFAYDFEQHQYLSVSPVVPDEADYLGPTIDGLLSYLNPSNPEWKLP